MPFKEEKFLTTQKNHLDSTLKKIISNNKREIAEKERECLQKKQNLIRRMLSLTRGREKIRRTLFLIIRVFLSFYLEREATLWDMEEKYHYERHQLLKQQLKDRYFLQRHQLLKKHEKVNQRSNLQDILFTTKHDLKVEVLDTKDF